MEEAYWELFTATGAPAFYLLYRREETVEAEAKTAFAATAASEA